MFRNRQLLTRLTSKSVSRHNGVKAFRAWCALCIFTWERLVRHTGVRFCHTSTSKRAPSMRCLPHFDFEIRFTLQRRAIFHLSSPQLAPHPPLYRVYFSTFWSHKTLEKRNVARYFQLFARLHFFFLMFLFGGVFFALLFPDSSHLCLSSVQIVKTSIWPSPKSI